MNTSLWINLTLSPWPDPTTSTTAAYTSENITGFLRNNTNSATTSPEIQEYLNPFFLWINFPVCHCSGSVWKRVSPYSTCVLPKLDTSRRFVIFTVLSRYLGFDCRTSAFNDCEILHETTHDRNLVQFVYRFGIYISTCCGNHSHGNGLRTRYVISKAL